MTQATSFLSTGLSALDRFLGGGWSSGALTGLVGRPGGGKTSLAVRAAAGLTRLQKPVAVISRGSLFFPPAFAAEGVDLAHLLWLSPPEPERCRWALEQVVRSGLFPLVVAHQLCLEERGARRLQLAAESSGAAVLFLQTGVVVPWPFFLCCEVERRQNRLRLRVVKSRMFLSQLQTEVCLNETTDSGDSLSQNHRVELAS